MVRTSSTPRRVLLRARLLLLASFVIATASAGCGGATYTTAGEAQTIAAANYQPGQSVQVEWRGSWYAATIVAVLDGGQYHIHYDGWGDEWDEAVDALRIRTEGEVIAPPSELIAPQVFVDDSGQAIENTGTQDDPGGYTPTPESPLPAGLRPPPWAPPLCAPSSGPGTPRGTKTSHASACASTERRRDHAAADARQRLTQAWARESMTGP